MIAAFKERIREISPVFTGFDALKTLQVNLGNLCNQSCLHCHVKASPQGGQIMGRKVMEKVIEALSRHRGATLDITGGCPEMNPDFRFLIEATEGSSPRRMLRSNLTIMTEPGMEWLPAFIAGHKLEVIASLPCYLEENVDRQRGKGVYRRSIEALKMLNALGYGNALELNLVYNPGGDFIPGSQQGLEAAYRKELRERHGIRFNSLYTISNAPIGRFRDQLDAQGAFDRYFNLLAASFNPRTAGNIMCRTLVSVDWQGRLYNCDFNQAMGLPVTDKDGEVLSIDDLDKAAGNGSELVLAQHCYSCTAGEGSSCTGALAV